MSEIRVNLNGLEGRFRDIESELDSLRKPFNKSGVYLEKAIGKRFSSGGGSKGGWKPLKASTIKRHPHRAGGKPLNDTGRLKQSATSGAYKRIAGKQMRFVLGTSVVYGPSHNFGYRHIPQREFFYADAEDEKAIRKIFEDFVRGIIRNG